MAQLTGTFLANFQSFYTAVEKAQVHLKGMETDAHKVGKSLDRMVDGFAGRKLVQEATLVTEAVRLIGGASKLTEAEQAKVNRTVTEAIAKYHALGQSAPPAMLALANATRAVEQPTSRVNGYMNDLTNQIKATALGFISAQAVLGAVSAGFRSLTAFVGSSIESFAAAEAAQKKLTTALQAQGMATPAVISQYDKLATQFQKTTVFSDDLVTEMQGLLVQVGNVMPSEMDKALTAATDLASGLGIDLRQATMLVGKAFEGETGTLKRYGIVIDDAKLKAGGMPVVLDAIQARFGGQAQAELETYAGKIKQLGNEWDNLKEKVGGYIATDPVLLAAMRGAASAATDNDESVTGWNVAMSVLVASTPGWLVALKNIHADLTPIAEAANSAAAAMKLIKPPDIFPASGPTKPTGGPDPKTLVEQWAKDQKKAEDAANAAKSAAIAAAKAFREMADAMSGAKVIADANKQLELIAFNMQRGVPLAKMTRENQDAINKSMADAMAVYRLMGQEVPPAIKAVYFATLDVGKGIPVVAGLSSEFANVGKWAAVAATEMGRAVPVTQGLGAEFGRIGETVQREVIPPTEQWGDELDELARGLAQLSQVSDDAFGGIIGDLATLVTSLDTANKAVKSFKDGKKEGFSLSGILGMSTGILGIASAALAAGRAIKGMFSGDTAGRDLVKDFAASFGGFDALHAELATLNRHGDQAGERLWVALTSGVGKNNPEQAKAAIDAITEALGDAKDAEAAVASARNANLASLIGAAENAGRRLPAAMQPYIEQLRLAGLLTNENALALEGMGGGASVFRQMEEAANKYGIEIGALGPIFQQQKLTDTATGIINSFDMLIENGADFNGVLAGMKDEINAVVIDSLKFGTKIPENMRPWIQKLIDSGQLLDGNKNKITDINTLQFGEHVADPMVTALQELITLLRERLPQAAADSAAGIKDAFARNPPVIRPRIDMPDMPDLPGGGSRPQPPEFARGTGGQYLNFGSGTLAMLHGRERVMTEAEGKSAASITIVTKTYLDGRQVAESVVPYIPSALKRHGVT